VCKKFNEDREEAGQPGKVIPKDSKHSFKVPKKNF